MTSGRVPGWVWAVLVLAHGLALGWSLHSGNWNFPDTDRYVQAADNLRLYGELYARPWMGHGPRGQAMQEFTIRTVGYPAAVLGLGGETGRPVLLLFVQNLLSMLNIGVVLNWWANRVRPAIAHWLLALLGVLLFPAQIIYANAVMSEVLLQAVILALVAAGWMFTKTGKTRYFVGIVACAVASLLLKPVFYPLTVVLAGVGLLVAWPRRQVQLAVWGLVPLLVVGLYMRWNEQRTGYFHFSSIAEINLLHYNAAGVVRQAEGPAAEEKWVTSVLQEADAQPDFAARQRLIRTRAEAMLWAHPVMYAGQHAQGMVAMLLDPGRFDISQFGGIKPPADGGMLAQVRANGLLRAVRSLPLGLLSVLGLVLGANLVRLVLAARGFWRLGNDEPALRYGRWIAAALLFYVALLTGPLGAARFLVPVWPLLLGLALAGVKWRETSDGLGPNQTTPVREDQRQSGAENGRG